MSKTKTFALALPGTVVHFALTLWVVASRLECGIVPQCVSSANMIVGNVLSVPLGLITWLFNYAGINVVRLFGSWLILFLFLNSFLAVTLIWHVLIRPVVQRIKKVRAESHLRGIDRQP